MTDAAPESPSGTGPQRDYSTAFESFVDEGEDDLVGLLAYALYKQTIWQSAHDGQDVRGPRNPPQVLVRRFRESAENLLFERATEVVQEQAEELQQSAALTAIEAQASEIKALVTARTRTAPNLLGSLLMSLVAWIITLALTFLVLRTNRPSEIRVVTVPAGVAAPASNRTG